MMLLFCGSNLHRLFIWDGLFLKNKNKKCNFKISLYPCKKLLGEQSVVYFKYAAVVFHIVFSKAWKGYLTCVLF